MDENKIISKIEESSKFLQAEIRRSVESQFLEISPELKDLIDLSVEIWRIEKRLNKISSKIQETQQQGILTSLLKMKRYLERNDIEVNDYSNHKYIDGLNLDVLTFEKNNSIKDPIIKEMVEPSVMFKGKLVKKGKVVVIGGK
tara:strand:- start:76 stop:504 length:429 start_codon:yes stop_codon:yes gene_type:complete